MTNKSYLALSNISDEFPLYFDNAGLEFLLDIGITALIPKEDIDNDILNKNINGKTLNDLLDYYYYGRKTWLKNCSIIILLGSIIQIILVIIYNYCNPKEKQKHSSSSQEIIDPKKQL
ncbi:hypothetical protein BCR32DRAFT_324891 [Anaeromyces robustus]|uniref:Uncharacterized protein n=1 Tax=Anaeromyces robustus TaxID=1754192 RepID=A0A1Y1XLG2_9FUNG|nr:hypothetical protein BCR32DRAFT_324891 [Anaeromyces robustus]|eukprot:ORX86589.1 hypothetical protein BCR32DRAFT_324891 [Anaeromyces robustus]